MEIRTSEFVKSITSLKDRPRTVIPEFGFIGRSNVGKSSLINMLLSRKNLARISSTPGKTQTINYYLINNEWYAVDLPGYGWAKVSKQKKIAWSGFVRDYLLTGDSLACLFILIDARHEPQTIDLQFLYWMVENEIPIALVFTKADKLSRNKVNRSVQLYKNILLRDWVYLPEIFITSAMDKRGREEMLEYIELIKPG